MQHPYPHLQSEASPTPWNVAQQFSADNDVAAPKKSHADGPLNLSKPKSSGEHHKNSSKNDGNNNSSKNLPHSIEHLAAGSKMMQNVIPRHPFNLPFNGEEADLFRLWPMMAAAAQNHPSNPANNLPNLLAGNHRDLMAENAFTNFAHNLNESKGKRTNEQAGLSPTHMSDDKIRLVRQQPRGGRGGSNAEAMGGKQ